MAATDTASSGSTKMSQTEILKKLGIPTTSQEMADIEGNGKLQQYINQLAALKGLPEPFNPSTASAIIQDLIPLAALAEPAATGADAAEGAAGGDAAAGGAAGATAAEAAGAVTALTGAVAASDIWTWLTTPAHWVRIGEYVAGAVLIFMALREMEK